MKSVLISIQPKWCELIANGKKTVEVRKTRPKLETPFKVYIYCTMGNLPKYVYNENLEKESIYAKHPDIINGKVIGEFVCDRIFVADCDSVAPFDKHTKRYIDKESCLSKEEFVKYTRMYFAYGWHISNLVIYDKPKELSEFHRDCEKYICNGCPYLHKENTPSNFELWCKVDGEIPITRPPQSWCYVEE